MIRKKFKSEKGKGKNRPVGRLLYEQEPGPRTVFASPATNAERWLHDVEGHFPGHHIALPYVYFLIDYTFDKNKKYQLTGLTVFFRNEAIKSKDDQLGISVFPEFCLGSAHPMPEDTPEKLAEAAIQAFWETSFNIQPDWPSNIEKMTFRQWATKSKQDPQFMLKYKWPVVGTVETFLSNEHMIYGFPE